MAESQEITTDVLVCGAGPAGLLLARELEIAGVATMVIDKLPKRSGICRGFTLNARSLDILARRDILHSFLAEGWKVPYAAFSGLPVTPMLEGAATDHSYSLGIGQDRVEQLLEAEATRTRICIQWGHELRSFVQDSTGITAMIAEAGHEKRVRARYLAGCDGSRSLVRKLAGIDFPGTAAKRFMLLGDVELAEPDSLSFGINRSAAGSVFVIPRPNYVRIIVRDPQPAAEKDEPVLLEHFSEVVCAALDREVVLRNPRWLTRFGDAARQAAQYIDGRVVLAGDSAHIHPPAGAIGVNVALDDAFNLGWKLAATVRGDAPAYVLDSYHAERHAAGERILENTQAQVLLAENSDELRPLRGFLTRLFNRRDVTLALAEVVTCLDTCYERTIQKDKHPWLGCMVPDFGLEVEGRKTRLTELLRDGNWVLIDSTQQAQFVRSLARPFANLRAVHATDVPEATPKATLVRPDGHAAWVWNGCSGEHLRETLARWFGTT